MLDCLTALVRCYIVQYILNYEESLDIQRGANRDTAQVIGVQGGSWVRSLRVSQDEASDSFSSSRNVAQ